VPRIAPEDEPGSMLAFHLVRRLWTEGLRSRGWLGWLRRADSDGAHPTLVVVPRGPAGAGAGEEAASLSVSGVR
jgi:hypothetical protein